MYVSWIEYIRSEGNTIMYVQKPKNRSSHFQKNFQDTFELVSEAYENIIVIGDLNFNMFQDNMLSSIIPSFSLTNIIKDATCYKSSQPTLIDVMLVTKRRNVLHSFSENTYICDFHNLIGLHKPAPKTKKVSVRKLAKIDYETVLSELSNIDLSQAIMGSTVHMK